MEGYAYVWDHWINIISTQTKLLGKHSVSETMATEKSVMAVIRASRPSFRNPHDKVAFAVHSTFVSSGYILTATGKPAFSDTALSSTSTDEVGIEQWNELEDDYAFVYCKPEKGSKKVLVKCLVMNDKLLVAALADGASEPIHLEINVEDYIAENGGTNYFEQFTDLDKFVETLDKEIFSKLDGSKDKPTSSQTRAEQKQNLNEPGIGAVEPQYTQSYPSGLVYPPIGPIGSSDLFPGPGAGMYPPRGDFGGGGGMLLGPDDPYWFGGVGKDPSFPGGLSGIPPGARFDPYGPPGVPGFEPNRFTRVPRRPGRGTHPDLEHFGSGTDF